MRTSSFTDFMKELKPWLSSNYIRKVSLNNKGHFVILFVDGVTNVYNIENCTESQKKMIFKDLKEKGLFVQE